MIKKSINYSLFQFYRIKFKFIRFLITGIINTLFSLSIYWVLVYFEVHYSIAMFISNMLGILFNYKTTGKLVFENDSNKLILKFFAVNFLIYLLSIVGLKLLFLVGFDKYSSAVIIAPPMAVIAFFLSKLYVFKNTENKIKMETNSEAYKEHLENKYLPGRDKYLKWFFYPKILKQFNCGAIIDLGCGTGEFLQFLKLKNRKFSGMDNNPYLVKKCLSMGFDVKLDDITKLESIERGSVENALCDNVLEHLDVQQIDEFFLAIKQKMSAHGNLVIVVPDKKGFKHDPTHKTFVDKNIIETMCFKHGIQLKNNFCHPVDSTFVGTFFYLNMQVFALTF